MSSRIITGSLADNLLRVLKQHRGIPLREAYCRRRLGLPNSRKFDSALAAMEGGGHIVWQDDGYICYLGRGGGSYYSDWQIRRPQ